MLRIFLERAWLVALPFAAWFAWRAWARHTGRAMGATPWPWLFAAGAGLLAVSLIAGGLLQGHNRDDDYVPAEVGPDGRVIPGRFERRPAP